MKKIFYNNHLIKKQLSQNFLIDNNIIHNMINIMQLTRQDIIVEIGPGFGALTKEIIKFVNKLTVIEIDEHLSKMLKIHLAKKQVNIIQKNVTTINFDELSSKIGKPIRILGNLPYNIATKIIFHILKYSNIIYDMHFMIQKEVAQRLIATPNNKHYGRLSIILQYLCKITKLLEVNAHSFTPQPKVHSTVIKLLPYHKNNNPYPKTNIKTLNLISKIAFNQRRKTIKNSLKTIFTPKELKIHGINLQSRAENLSIKEYCYLSEYYKQLTSK